MYIPATLPTRQQNKKMKENHLLVRAAFPASHWHLRHTALSLSASGHVSSPGVWPQGFAEFWPQFIRKAGVHLLVTLLPSFSLVLLSEKEN